jgi:hypothetical protein
VWNSYLVVHPVLTMPSDLVARGVADRDDFLATMVVVVQKRV